MTLLALDRLTVRRGDCPVVDGVTLDIAGGELVGLIGPNGAGKTTLLRGALGLLPAAGFSSLAALPAAARARHAAWLPQNREIAWPVTVRDLVALGRIAHGAPDPDHPAVDRALAEMGLVPLAGRRATELSGGEQARALIARALAQEAPLVIADEPVAGLDPAAQIATMQVFGGLARSGRGILVSMHDLGLAARHCTRILVLHRGRLVADGAPADVLAPALLAAVFGIRAHLEQAADGLVVQPVALAEAP
ncbi:MAG: ABC transporter ATP-binding protein [Rhodobacteraceae bacterium]|nr:ABC transporter ATP-binding protein [Paracoccaceae bacterium]